MADSIYAQEPIPPPVEKPKGLQLPLDFSHHFSRVTKARQQSSIKDFYKFFQIPGIANLAGGKSQSRKSYRRVNADSHSQDSPMPRSSHTIHSKHLLPYQRDLFLLRTTRMSNRSLKSSVRPPLVMRQLPPVS
jgi:hypothetical protein